MAEGDNQKVMTEGLCISFPKSIYFFRPASQCLGTMGEKLSASFTRPLFEWILSLTAKDLPSLLSNVIEIYLL